MLDIEFRFNGRKVRADQFGDELEKAMLKKITQNIHKRIPDVVCPIHGERPRIVCKGKSLEKLSLEVRGCCDELTKAIKVEID